MQRGFLFVCDLVVMRERTPITAGLLAKLPRLRLLVTSGMRNAAIDVAAAKAHRVWSYSEPTAIPNRPWN